DIEQAQGFGWSVDNKTFDWKTLIANKNREIERLNGIYKNLLVDSGVTLLQAHARLVDAHTVEVAGTRYSAGHLLGATGRWPHVPDFPGNEHVLNSDDAFSLVALPRRVLVGGGGYIAVEFDSFFHGCGAETHSV